MQAWSKDQIRTFLMTNDEGLVRAWVVLHDLNKLKPKTIRSGWDQKFIDSVLEQKKMGKPITKKQYDVFRSDRFGTTKIDNYLQILYDYHLSLVESEKTNT